MEATFAHFPEALAQTQSIAEQCQDALPDGRFIWPALNLEHGQSAEQKLRSDARAGMHKHYGADPPKEIERAP